MSCQRELSPDNAGKILKVLFLEPAGISQLQLANYLGSTPTNINNIIAGRKRLRRTAKPAA